MHAGSLRPWESAAHRRRRSRAPGESLASSRGPWPTGHQQKESSIYTCMCKQTRVLGGKAAKDRAPDRLLEADPSCCAAFLFTSHRRDSLPTAVRQRRTHLEHFLRVRRTAREEKNPVDVGPLLRSSLQPRLTPRSPPSQHALLARLRTRGSWNDGDPTDRKCILRVPRARRPLRCRLVSVSARLTRSFNGPALPTGPHLVCREATLRSHTHLRATTDARAPYSVRAGHLLDQGPARPLNAGNRVLPPHRSPSPVLAQPVRLHVFPLFSFGQTLKNGPSDSADRAFLSPTCRRSIVVSPSARSRRFVSVPTST